MEKTVRDLLLDALDELPLADLTRFKAKLNQFPVAAGYNKIPRGRLEGADSLALCDLLINFYTERYGVEVAAAVLDSINQRPLAQTLRDAATGADPRDGTQNQLPASAAGASLSSQSQVLPVAPPGGGDGLHFVERHRDALIQRSAGVEGVLDMLYGSILNEEQYQNIVSQRTSQEKMRELYKLMPSWNQFCKDQLYEALKAKNRFLINDLEGN
uniref:PYD and CARD domain containing n=1 Tax=Sphenodon punctatus TaxID=8508 RepID=A0A8D0G610_SPHPU